MAIHGKDPRDTVVVPVVAVIVLAGSAIAPPGRIGLDPLGYVLLVAALAALAVRRRAPVVALAVTTLAVLAYFVRGYPGVVAALPLMVALFTAVWRGHRVALAVPFATLVLLITADVAIGHGPSVREVIQNRFLITGWLVAAAMMGGALRQWELWGKEVERRAAEAERTREETALRRAGEERLRIARELHDSLTHGISIIKVQSGVAIHLARKRGEEVPEALLAVQDASRDAMRELRTTLAVLRGPEVTGGGLDRLGELIERARSAGQPVTVTITGDRRPLPVEVGHAAYRIVQEALTNISRHAGPATATVRIEYGPRALTVQVDDDGLAMAEPPPEPGVGLTGMHERVAALSGSLRAGPRPEGGFSVRAELPLPDPAEDLATATGGAAR